MTKGQRFLVVLIHYIEPPPALEGLKHDLKLIVNLYNYATFMEEFKVSSIIKKDITIKIYINDNNT